MTHVLRVGVADQIAYFRAFNTDGSARTDLTSATAGLSLSVFRVGLASVSIASPSNKAADNTAHADGAIRNVGGNLYTIDLPDAAAASQTSSLGVRGTFTGGVIEPVPHPVVAYDPAVVAVGANTTAPDNATIAAGAASAATAATQSTSAASSAASAATAAASADSKLSSTRLSRLDRLPDVNAGASGGLSLVGSQMTLDNATLTALFADADVAALLASITALFDGATDLPVQTIAAQAASETVAALLANGSIATLIADAAAGKVASEAVSARATEARLAKLDRDLARVSDVQVTVTPNVTVNPTEVSTGSINSIRDGLALKTDVNAARDAVIAHGDGPGAWGAVGSGGGGGGPGLSGPFVFTVTVIDSETEEPIELANVRAFRTGKDGTLPTSADGVVELPVDAATYKIVVSADNYQSLIVERSFTGDAAETFELTLRPNPATPIDGTCEIIDYVLDSGKRPVEGATVRAIASEDAVLADTGILTQLATKAITGADGRFVLRLARADAMTAGKSYTIEIKHQAKSIYRQVVGEVPNQETALLKEITTP